MISICMLESQDKKNWDEPFKIVERIWTNFTEQMHVSFRLKFTNCLWTRIFMHSSCTICLVNECCYEGGNKMHSCFHLLIN